MLQERKKLLTPHEALSALVILLSNTEPSPVLLSKILTPIIPELYLLSYDLDKVKTADPHLKESISGLLLSWGKIIDQAEGSRTLWSIVEGNKSSQWHFDLEGRFWKTKQYVDDMLKIWIYLMIQAAWTNRYYRISYYHAKVHGE